MDTSLSDAELANGARRLLQAYHRLLDAEKSWNESDRLVATLLLLQEAVIERDGRDNAWFTFAWWGAQLRDGRFASLGGGNWRASQRQR